MQLLEQLRASINLLEHAIIIGCPALVVVHLLQLVDFLVFHLGSTTVVVVTGGAAVLFVGFVQWLRRTRVTSRVT